MASQEQLQLGSAAQVGAEGHIPAGGRKGVEKNFPHVPPYICAGSGFRAPAFFSLYFYVCLCVVPVPLRFVSFCVRLYSFFYVLFISQHPTRS